MPEPFNDFKLGPEAMHEFIMGYRSQMAGNIEAAVQHYRRSLELEETAEAHTFLGWAYSFVGMLDEAIAECHKAIAVDPEFGNPYNDIGAYYLQMMKFEEAIPWLQRAKKAARYSHPEFPCCNLARAYERLGRWKEAIAEYRLALELQPNYRAAAEGLAKLTATMN